MTALLASFGAGRPPLRGIVHAAAQVRDEALLDTSAEVLASVMGPKAAGGWLLHRAEPRPSPGFLRALLVDDRVAGIGSPGTLCGGESVPRRARPPSEGGGTAGAQRELGHVGRDAHVSEEERRAFAQAGLRPMRSEDALDAMGRLAAGPAAQVTSRRWTGGPDRGLRSTAAAADPVRPAGASDRGAAGCAPPEPVDVLALLEERCGRRAAIGSARPRRRRGGPGARPPGRRRAGALRHGHGLLMAVELRPGSKRRTDSAALDAHLQLPECHCPGRVPGRRGAGPHSAPAPVAAPAASQAPAPLEDSSTRTHSQEDELAALLADKRDRR